MTEEPREPAGPQGPFFQDALRHADAIDNATSAGERGRAWARLIPSMLAALIEDYVRDTTRFGVVLLSLAVAIVGLESPHFWAGIIGVLGAVSGTVAVFVPLARRSTFARQWAVIVAVILAEAALLVAFWQWA